MEPTQKTSTIEIRKFKINFKVTRKQLDEIFDHGKVVIDNNIQHIMIPESKLKKIIDENEIQVEIEKQEAGKSSDNGIE